MISKHAIGTTATLVRSAEERRWIIIQNLSDTDVFLALDGSTDVTIASGLKPGVRIAANGGNLSVGESQRDTTTNFPIYAIHGGTGTKDISFQFLP